MKKINHLKLKICMFILVLVLMVVQVGPFLVYADESKLTFSYHKYTQPATNEYYDGKNLYFSQAKIGQYTAYCLDYGLQLPTSSGGKVTYLRKLSPVTTAVMKYGHPYSTPSQLGVNNAEEAELATQLAVWSVVNASSFEDSKKATKVLDMDNLKPVSGYESYMSRVKAAARRLIDRALAAPYYSDPQFYINPANAKLTVNGNYMLAGPYEVKATGFDVSKITISLVNAPSSAQVTDANGNAKTTVKSGDNIYVKMLSTEKGSEMTIKGTVSGNTVIGKVYGTGNSSDGRQDYGLIVTSPVQLTDTTTVKWTSLTGNIQIYKVDQNKNVVPGVKFELRDMNNKVVKSATTNSQGIIEFKDLAIGKYKLVEVEVPDGYVMATEAYEIEVTTGSTKKITFQNKKIDPGKIEITKVDQDGRTIPGCSFELKDANGKVVKTGTTDASGKLVFNNLEAGKYYLKETAAPAGYEMKADAVEINVQAGKTIAVKFPNKRIDPGKIEITKVDQDGKTIQGCSFELKDANGKVVKTGTTDRYGKLTFDNLAAGKYYLKETAAPAGYEMKADAVEIDVQAGKTIAVKFPNRRIDPGTIVITKVDQDGNTIPNCSFELKDANGKVVKTGTTDRYGKLTFDNLEAGKYYLKETAAPAGYEMKADAVEIDVQAGKTIALKFPNRRINGGLKIVKVDENNNPISGVKFEIYDSNRKLVETITTGTSGVAETTVKLAKGKYYYKEVSAPANVIIDSNMYEFEISGYDDVVTKTVTNKLKKGKLIINKITEGDRKPLSGVTFQILDANKKVVDTITTNANGVATSKELPKGKYYYKETKVPSGIKLDSTEYEFTMDYKDITKEVVNKYSTGTLKIIKVDESKNPIEGVAFEIYDSNKKLLEKIVTNKEGIAVSTVSLKVGKYYYKEVSAPANVIMDTEMHAFEITGDNQVVIKNLVNYLKKGKLTIYKVTEGDKKPLAGVTFEILNANRQVIQTITTDSNGIATTRELPKGKYYYRETVVPTGIMLNSVAYEFTMDYQDIRKEVVNKYATGLLKILKVDENKVPLEGVAFEIYGANKNFIEKIVTNKLGVAMSTTNLKVGKYYYKEVSAPNNIIIDTNMYEFEVTTDEQVVIKNIVNNLKKGKLTIYKVTEGDKKPLAGVTFQILDSSKRVVETITTDSNGIATTKELPKGKYYYKEIKVPTGIKLDSNEYEFTMDYQDVRKEVVNKYSTGTLKIIKVDENKVPLEGVAFEIYDANKNLLEKIVTNKEGIAESTVELKVGKYYYKEVSAPDNIIIDTNMYEFEINGVDDVVIRNIKNNLKKGKLTIYKTTEDGKALEGVTFQILNENKKVVDTITTGKDGIATTKELPKGKYYYKEIKVPAGIKLDSTEYEFTMDYQDVRKEVVNKYATGTLKIIKVDENKVPLEGVAFEIYDADKNLLETIVTNKDGIAESTVELKVGKYYYKEVSAPDNIIIDTNMYEFEINGVDDVVIRNIKNNLKKGKLEIYKTTEDGKALEGVTFQILDENKKVVDTITTGKDGIATTKELPKGKYYYKETKVPFGIRLDSNEYEFTMDYQNVKVEIVNEYALGTLKILKVDDNEIPVKGVKFEIYDENKNLVDTIVTDANGVAMSKELHLGTYYYKEVEAPANVIMDTEMHKFEITKDGEVVIKNLVNNLVKGQLKIVKVSDKGTPIANVTFQILNEAKEVIEEVTTDKDGIAMTKPLKAGKYYYRETEAPVSVIADYTEYEFIVETNDQVIEKKVVNELVKGSLKIIKTDDLKAPLANVKFEILNKDKNVIQTIVTNEEGIAISDKLTIGKYYFREVEAPENVVMDTKEYEFKVLEHNQVIEREVVNKRIEGKLIIHKLDKDTKAPIEGVTFQIMNEAREVIETVTTDKDGFAGIGGLLKGKYYFKEVEAPEDYIMNSEEFSFEIVKDMQTVEATVYNEHLKLPVTGGFIGTNTLIIMIVSIVVIGGYVAIKFALSRRA